MCRGGNDYWKRMKGQGGGEKVNEALNHQHQEQGCSMDID